LPVHYIKPFIEIKVGFIICLNFRRSLNGLATDFLALYSHININIISTQFIIIIICLIILIIIYFIPSSFFPILEQIKNSKIFISLTYLLSFFIFFIIIIKIQASFIGVLNVLQASHPVEQKILQNYNIHKVKNNDQKNIEIYTKKIIPRFVAKKFNSCRKGSSPEFLNPICLFDWQLSESTNKRKKTYITLVYIYVFLFFLLLIPFFVIHSNLNWHNSHLNWYKRIFPIIFIISILLEISGLAYLHGILGGSYIYPVITVKYKHDKAIKERKGVYLIGNKNNFVTILDRKNTISFLKIPTSNITIMEQHFLASPLENCSPIKNKDTLILCEKVMW